MCQLDNIKSPFEDGLPKVVVLPPKPILEAPIKPVEPPKPLPPPVITLPDLKVQGVIVGEGIQEAIINDKVVSFVWDRH